MKRDDRAEQRRCNWSLIPSTPRHFKLWLGSNCLHSVSGWVSYGDNGPGRPNNRVSATGQNGSNKSIAFSVSDKNVLDWTSLFFRGISDPSLWNRRTNLALVCYLDGD